MKEEKNPDIDILVDALKEIASNGKCDLESIKRIKDNRVFNILTDLTLNLEARYIRINHKDDSINKFSEDIRKPNATKV